MLMVSPAAGLASGGEEGMFEGTKFEVRVDGFDTSDIDAAKLEAMIREHHPEAEDIEVDVDEDGLEIKIEGFDTSSIMFSDKVKMLEHKFMGADRLEVRLETADGTKLEFRSDADENADVNIDEDNVDENNEGEN